MQKIVVDCLKSLNHISRVPNLVSNFHTSDRNVQVFKFCATQKISPAGQLLVRDVRQALQKLSTGDTIILAFIEIITTWIQIGKVNT